MLNPSQTPSPKPKSRFFSNLRRSLRSNSQLTSVPESLFDPVPHGYRIPSHADTSSSYATSSSSSNPSSPASNTPSRQLTPPQRRHASSFSKITFSAKMTWKRVPFFAIPTTRKVSYGTQDMQSQEQTSNAHTKPIPAKKPLINPKENHAASNINQPECSSSFLFVYTISGRFGPSHNDPYCSESYSSDLGHDDSPTLGYYSEFPTTSNTLHLKPSIGPAKKRKPAEAVSSTPEIC
ncbi:hypothetical protein PGTUg99_009530 [Puccinia graminis f. sp. tritici]|uniref:Uncharacterized protein n=1 Tax=Puccinia graminis f. sp. tritici TaxID=56615 RepID=A0A5B0PST9_PUCGR|nr:hypothetical protein PGTUg99_009530 [Puccinia graminis f. sp. tritici]